jgi:septal ring factor EnvC (AmiA/AmiB activator)
MSEIDSDDPRSRAAEQQMRRVLGLREGSSPPSRFSNSTTHVQHPQRRQFIRDGDVPVEVLHRHDNSRVNQLAATREALQAQTVAREGAERLVTDARQTIHDLQTKLGHERLAREEAVQHTDGAMREFEQEAAARQELEDERALRMTAARARDQAVLARQAAEDRLRQAKEARKVAGRVETSVAAEPPPAPTQPRRRGRPPKVVGDDKAVVEWWEPGWRDGYR